MKLSKKKIKKLLVPVMILLGGGVYVARKYGNPFSSTSSSAPMAPGGRPGAVKQITDQILKSRG